ncbi:uncharacterized protein LOC114271252 [Camellia sinensis]|uniref:uncharacterized protein LOC114271252 n=1 Tax=Camellia sinensis TaxID=4442 RepID=UPI0010361FA7|nr:uncharacterized protein LOC114271252 [Camellia sinensis]
MFTSKEWVRSTYSTSVNAKKAQGIILGVTRFQKAIKYYLKCVLPLVKILRLVDGDTKDLQLHRPFHAATYYLNSMFHYQENFTAYTEVKIGLFKTIERMSLDIEDGVKVDEQLEKFKKAEVPPGKRNWSTFDHVHSKKRNQLEQQRLNALVFVKYNVQLELRQIKRQDKRETYDPIYLPNMEFDYEWITEKKDPCLPKDHSWIDIQECFEDDEGATSSKKRKIEEEEDEEEFDEMTIVDDDEEDNSDIDLEDYED